MFYDLKGFFTSFEIFIIFINTYRIKTILKGKCVFSSFYLQIKIETEHINK